MHLSEGWTSQGVLLQHPVGQRPRFAAVDVRQWRGWRLYYLRKGGVVKKVFYGRRTRSAGASSWQNKPFSSLARFFALQRWFDGARTVARFGWYRLSKDNTAQSASTISRSRTFRAVNKSTARP